MFKIHNRLRESINSMLYSPNYWLKLIIYVQTDAWFTWTLESKNVNEHGNIYMCISIYI